VIDAFEKCHSLGRTLPSPATKAEFDKIYRTYSICYFKIIFYILLTKIDKMTIIIWDEAFLDTNGVLKWCSRPKVAVPVPHSRGGVNINQEPFFLISSPSNQTEPYLKAEAINYPSEEALCQIPSEFFKQNKC